MTTALESKPTARTVSRAEWLAARREFLAKEKEFTRLRDELSRQRRELPWEKVEKPYTFAGPEGKVTLADLFGARSQLVVYHFMLGPGWKEGCPSCSYIADSFDGMSVHLAARDTSLVAISRATFPEIASFKKRMGWRFSWFSSNGNDFNFDYRVSFSKEEMARGKVQYNYDQTEFPSEEAPGLSVFYKNDKGEIYHTYSTYARGLDILIGAYNFLDMTPKGRDEDNLPHSMAWVRHHDRYAHGEAASCCSGGEVKARTIAEPMLVEFQDEVNTTRRVLDRLPADRLGWRPHPKSMSLGQLAMHIATVPGGLARLTQQDGFDEEQANFESPQPKSVDEIRGAFDESVRAVEQWLGQMTDERAVGSWRLTKGEREIFTKPRHTVMRSIMLNHWYHHRGQLSVYLRLLEVPVPVIYGRSADENPFA
ncbi:MAG TPA: DinB family protein [Terriglobales bacterium]|nr:DinB family protein [Terriglobales bacterium]